MGLKEVTATLKEDELLLTQLFFENKTMFLKLLDLYQCRETNGNNVFSLPVLNNVSSFRENSGRLFPLTRGIAHVSLQFQNKSKP